MEILITASIGLTKVDGNYFMQVITADEDKFYNVQLTPVQAKHISKTDNIEIEELDGLPEGYLLGGDIH